MNDQLIRDLLHEVADEVEPGERLDAIRAATAPGAQRPHRRWWAAGGIGLVAASVVAALALSTDSAPRTVEQGPAGSPSTDTTPIEVSPSAGPVAVYFVGDTAEGPRLFREFRSDIEPNDVVGAVQRSLWGDALDPDYRSPWPQGVELSRIYTGSDGVVGVILTDAPVERPAGMSEQDARLAMEQLVRTVQAAYGQGRVPVEVEVDQEITDTILGVPTTAPLTGDPDLDVLAPVSLSDPSEGRVVRAGRRVEIGGRARSDDGMVSLQVARREGTAVLDVGTYTLFGTSEHPDVASVQDTLAPFSVSFASQDLRPGEYDVIATVRNADGTVDSDTRRITVVD